VLKYRIAVYIALSIGIIVFVVMKSGITDPDKLTIGTISVEKPSGYYLKDVSQDFVPLDLSECFFTHECEMTQLIENTKTNYFLVHFNTLFKDDLTVGIMTFPEQYQDAIMKRSHSEHYTEEGRCYIMQVACNAYEDKDCYMYDIIIPEGRYEISLIATDKKIADASLKDICK